MKIRFATVVAAMLLLSGCTGNAQPSAGETRSPTPSASPAAPSTATATPAPTSSPTPTAPPEVVPAIEVTMIRVTGAGIVFEGADGTVVDFVSSFQDADLLVSELEDVLGVAPVPYPTSEPLYLYVESGTTAWNFGGLIVADQGSGGYGGRAFKLIATVPSIGGVAIVTSGGFTIGDPIADTTSFFGQAPHFYDNDYAGTGTQNSYSDGTYTMQNPKVSVVAEGRSTIISLIIAPTGG